MYFFARKEERNKKKKKKKKLNVYERCENKCTHSHTQSSWEIESSIFMGQDQKSGELCSIKY